jgi:hypothetical protein
MRVLFLTLSAALLFAQPAGQLSTVEGKVVDASTELPIAGARVIAMRSDGLTWSMNGGLFDTQPSAGEQDPKADRMAVLTGTDGRFRLRFQGPASFGLWVDAAGYVKPLESIGPDNMFEVKPDAPKTDIVIKLARASALAGRVIDADTKEALPDFWVTARSYRPGGPRQSLMSAGDSATGKDGRFSLDRIAPGDYLLEVRPPHADRLQPPKPVEDFRHAVQKGYAPSWFPGVGRAEEAVPAHLAPGARIEGIEIGLSKKRIASVRGHVLGEDAAKADAHLSLIAVTTRLSSVEIRIVAQGDLKIGSEFEFANVSPGTYCLSAQFGLEKPDAKYATMTLEVGEENQDGLDLYLSRGLAIGGRVRMEGGDDDPEKSALPKDGMQVRLDPPMGFGSGHDPAPALAASKDGTFAIEGVVPSTYRLRIPAPPDGYAVSEVRYDGTLCAYGIVSVEAGANAQKLEIKLAPANSAVQATVTDGDQPAAGATLVLVPAGLTEPALPFTFDLLRKTVAGKDGRATVSALLPGTYRVTAYPQGASWADDPDLFQRLAAGDEVQLGAKQTATIAVRTQPPAGER